MTHRFTMKSSGHHYQGQLPWNANVSIPLENKDDYVNLYLFSTKNHVNIDKKCSVKKLDK